MARKLSGGLVGQPSVGAINVAPTAVVTAAENQDITLSPAGTSSLVVTNNVVLNAQSDLRFADSDSSNYVGFQAPATVSVNRVWTLPAADGTVGQVLATNGSGVLSWNNLGAITGNLTVSGTAIFNGGDLNLTPVTSISLTGTQLNGFVEGATTYSSITYTSVGGERKVTGFTATTTGISPRVVTITYAANGTIDTFTVT